MGKFYIHDDDTNFEEIKGICVGFSPCSVGLTLQNSLRMIVSVLLDLFKTSASCWRSGWPATCSALYCYLCTRAVPVPKCGDRMQKIFVFCFFSFPQQLHWQMSSALLDVSPVFPSLPRRSLRGPPNLVNILKYKSLQASVINMYLYRGINEHFVFLLLVGTDRIICI